MRNSRVVSIISFLFFVIVSALLVWTGQRILESSKGRNVTCNMTQLAKGEGVAGDYMTISDTGMVISAAGDIISNEGHYYGKAFLLNGIPDFIVVVTGEENLIEGKQEVEIKSGVLIPGALQGRLMFPDDGQPLGLVDLARQNGWDGKTTLRVLEAGITPRDTAIPAYISFAFSALSIIFALSSFYSGRKKNKEAK